MRGRGDARHFEGPGGTPGGLGSFLLGLVLSGVGALLILQHAQLTSGYWTWWGGNTFGITLVPLLVGIAVLFFDGRNILGWLLTLAGLLVVVTGILVHLQLVFPRTSIFNVVIMFGAFVGGLGLMARSLR